MRKATANKAIDFNRLFAVKDKLAKADDVGPVDDGPDEKGREVPTLEGSPSSPLELSSAAEAKVLDFPGEPPLRTLPPSGSESLGPITALRPPASLSPGESTETFGRLRVGMPRMVHERVRASAALACVPPTEFVRDLLESAAPRFKATAPLAQLSAVARAAFPDTGSSRRTIEVRMQVPMSEDLHRRLLQLAALRAQTLGACLLDLLDDRLPR